MQMQIYKPVHISHPFASLSRAHGENQKKSAPLIRSVRQPGNFILQQGSVEIGQKSDRLLANRK